MPVQQDTLTSKVPVSSACLVFTNFLVWGWELYRASHCLLRTKVERGPLLQGHAVSIAKAQLGIWQASMHCTVTKPPQIYDSLISHLLQTLQRSQQGISQSLNLGEH